jgi:putative NADH-flavin reductase
MRLAIFGASGRTARRLVKYTLADGHDVNALVRDGSRLAITDPHLRVITGDILTEADVERALEEVDAVLSALGVANATQPGTLLSDGMRGIVHGREMRGIARVLAVANSGVLDADDGRLRRDQPEFPEMFQAITPEHESTWRALRESTCDWTLVCPPDLKEGARTGRVRARRDRLPAGGQEMSVEDLAAFMLAQLGSSEYSRTRGGLAY